MKPNLFIIGAPKCATSTLRDYISEYIDAFIVNPIEPHYFSSDIIRNGSSFTNDAAYLEYYFPDNKTVNKKIVGEKSTWYLYSNKAIKDILNFNSNSKFIVLIRNPVDLIYSLHFQLLRTGEQEECNFKTAWRNAVENKNMNNIKHRYDQVGLIGERIDYIKNCIKNDDQLLILFFEDIEKNPKDVYQAVMIYLGLEFDKNISCNIKSNQYKAAKNEWAVKILTPPKFVYRMLNIMKSVLGIKSFRVGTKIYALKEKLYQNKQKPKLSSSDRKELIRFFEDDIHRIERLTDRNLSHWIEMK